MSLRVERGLGAESPEWKLILACARTHPCDLQRDRIRKLLNGHSLEWDTLISLAARHRVEALMSRTLASEFSDITPPVPLASLKQIAAARGRWSLHTSVQMIGLFDLLDADGLSAIPYKGPTLASLAYGNVALRSSDDLDFVLPQKEILRAFRLLLAAGLRTDLDPSNTRHARFLERGNLGQYLFSAPGQSALVELHTEKTLRYFPVPLEWNSLRLRMETVMVGGRAMRTFSVEDLLVLLSVHGAKHFWNRLSWICDIAELTQVSRGVDWDLSRDLARRMGCRRMWLLGLSLAHELLDAPIPEKVTRWIREEPGLVFLKNRALTTVGKDEAQINTTERLRFRISSHERVLDGVRQCVRVATRPTEDDWSRVVLPKWAEPLYSALRPWHLLCKHSVHPSREPVNGISSRASEAVRSADISSQRN